MRFQKSDKSWIVIVRRSEFPGSKSHWPSEFAIGSIQQGTGKIDVWPAAYGLQTRSSHTPPGYHEKAERLLQAAATRRGLFGAMKGYRKEERATGKWVVRLSTGQSARFHGSSAANEWAEKKLAAAPTGTTAGFFHSSGAYERTPYSVLKKNEYGHIVHAAISEHAGARRTRSSTRRTGRRTSRRTGRRTGRRTSRRRTGRRSGGRR